MTWIFSDTIPDLRFCGWCQEGKPATLEHYAPHKLGRYGLQSICRDCQKEDQTLRRQLKKANPWVETCACGSPATDLDHDHVTQSFRGYVCRPCNLKNRRAYVTGSWVK